MVKKSASCSFRKLTPVVLSGLLVLLPFTGYSQTTEQQLTDNLQLARDNLQQLDALADTCLKETTGSEACTEFRQAVDGDLLVAYLESCAVAKSWRDEFVSSQARDAEPTSSGSETLLNFLIDIEYLCGENALAQATDNVLPAYRLSKSASVSSSTLARSLQYQLDSARQNTLLDQQRNSLYRGTSSQSTRSQRQTQRQFDQLEIELIRQQLNQPLPR